MALTGKKLAFAKASKAGKSNRDAAVIGGYSEKSASAAGSRMAKDPDVKAYLADIKKRKMASNKVAPAQVKAVAPVRDGASAGLRSEPQDDDPLECCDDPREFLLKVMNNRALDPRQRIDAAKALMPFEHHKLGEGGKKDQKEAAAQSAGQGKFASAKPPLRAVR